MVGRWQSGAPLALAPDHDDPTLGADPQRSNHFGFGDDPRGFKCPAGAHARRANPRDALDGEGSVNVRLHRMIRRGTSFGPALPEGVLEDDGPIRRRLQGLPPFVVTRGGDYCFAPGLRAMRWLAELQT
jgi:deferrochelatase/peroxidase EfeB